MKRKVQAIADRPVEAISIFPTLLYTGVDVVQAEMLEILAAIARDKADVDDPAVKMVALEFSRSALAAGHVDLPRYSEVELTEMWFNVLQPGDHHWDHTHANHVLSGIIYLTDDCFTIFNDPRPAASVLAPILTNASTGIARTFIHCGKRNSIVIFPAWLPHRVATVSDIRKTIAFNVMLRGPYGGEYSREQTIL